jgi:hypothetical protein
MAVRLTSEGRQDHPAVAVLTRYALASSVLDGFLLDLRQVMILLEVTTRHAVYDLVARH